MKHERDRFVEQLANMYMPMKLKNEKGEEANVAVQALLQPVELWSFVFPEENLDTVLRTLNPTTDGIGIKSSMSSPKRGLALSALRKGLGLKKIPKWKKDGRTYPLHKDNMQIVAIGIKEDYKDKNGTECL